MPGFEPTSKDNGSDCESSAFTTRPNYKLLVFACVKKNSGLKQVHFAPKQVIQKKKIKTVI